VSVQGFELVEAFGVRVVEVDDLDRDVIYVADHDVALIDAALPPDRRPQVADWLLSEVCCELASPEPS